MDNGAMKNLWRVLAGTANAERPRKGIRAAVLLVYAFLGLLVAAAAGLVLMVWRDWRLFTLLAGSLVLHTFVTITYRAPQTVEYLMPGGYPPVAIAAGLAPVLVGSAIGIIPQVARSRGEDVQRGLLRFARNDPCKTLKICKATQRLL